MTVINKMPSIKSLFVMFKQTEPPPPAVGDWGKQAVAANWRLPHFLLPIWPSNTQRNCLRHESRSNRSPPHPGKPYAVSVMTPCHRGLGENTTSGANSEHHSRASVQSAAVPPISSCRPSAFRTSRADPNVAMTRQPAWPKKKLVGVPKPIIFFMFITPLCQGGWDNGGVWSKIVENIFGGQKRAKTCNRCLPEWVAIFSPRAF